MVIVKDRVRFVETDLMGVVHHSNYLRWFEMARVEALRQVGILLPEMLASGILFPITEVRCNYRNSAHFDEIIRIEAELYLFSKVKLCFRYRVLRDEDNLLLAEGETQNVFSDERGRIIRLPQHYYEKLTASGRKEEEGRL